MEARSSTRRYLPTPRPRLLLIMLPGTMLLAALICSTQLPNLLLNPIASICAPLLVMGALAMLWLGTRPEMPPWTIRLWAALPRQLRSPMLRTIIVTPLILLGLSTLARSTYFYLDTAPYTADAIAYLHIDADAILHGKNPYTQQNSIWDAALRWPKESGTPMIRGKLAGCAICYPASAKLTTLMQDEAHNPAHRHGEYDPATAHNYPAGSLWMVLPIVWAGGVSIVWLNYLATFLMILLVLLRSTRSLRPVIIAGLLCATIAFSTNFDAISLVFVLAAWHWRDHRLMSPILLGWACAVKQIAWFFVPFYLIEVGRREGWRAAGIRGLWLGIVFIVPNLPFIIADPHAWVASQLVPMSDPMFPSGMGFVAPSLSGVIPLWPPIVYTALEFTAWVGLAFYQLRRKAITSDGLLLALMPLFFARRDLINYIALVPLIALWLVCDNAQRRERAALVATPVTSSSETEQQPKHAVAGDAALA